MSNCFGQLLCVRDAMIRIIVKIPKITGRSDCDIKFSSGKIPIIFSQFN